MKELRMGVTTGSCATATAKAAAIMLLSGKPISSIKILTPKGIDIELELHDIDMQEDSVSCAVIKDAGDDPDITNGIKIFSTVTKQISGIQIDGGNGVGRVTKKGLAISVGNAAINPTPLKMIESELLEIKKNHLYKGGFRVVISVPNGEKIAERTFNPRLGIVGGISILGTTGIVEPMSQQAIIETIKLEMNVIKASGEKNLTLAPGNYGMDFLRNNFDVNLNKAVKCSNFIGEAIDYACYLKFKKILLVGHLGKMVKLAGGIMNTHSHVADCRMEILSAHTAMAGATDILPIMESITTEQAFQVIKSYGLIDKVLFSLKQKIRFHLEYRTKDVLQIDFVFFTDDIIMESFAKEITTPRKQP